MVITLTGIDKGGDFALMHDLNFQSEHYEAKHPIVGFFRRLAMNPSSCESQADLVYVLIGIQKPKARTS